MKRLAFAAIAFLVGCNGMGSGGGLLPAGMTSKVSPLSAGADAARVGAIPLAAMHHGKAKVRFTLTVPRRRRGETFATRHPATISSLTQSVGIAVNGGTAQVFTVTPTSNGCSAGASGTVCTLSVDAPLGADTFVISTYSSAAPSTSTMLDQGTAQVTIVAGKANTASITLGPVVTSSNDSGPGSLRYAIASANPGDTIMFVNVPAGTIIDLASPITLTNRVSIAGPGVTVSARHGRLRAHGTYSGLTISGGGLHQIFVVKTGSTATISGFIFTSGVATVSNQPGGAIYNAGTLTLVNDVFLQNTSTVRSPDIVRSHGKRSFAFASRADAPHGLHPHCTGSSSYGGALYNHATLTLTGNIFDSNTVTTVSSPCGEIGAGGAIYNDEYGILTSTNDQFDSNTALQGGAVYNNSEFGQASFTNDTFNSNVGCTAATGCATTCSGTSECTSEATGGGAAIFDNGGPGVSISNSLFENNVAGGATAGSYGQGGAVNLETGSPSVTGSTFENNLVGGGTSNCSSGDGGAMYVSTSGPLELDNDTFTGNVASGDSYGYGGAIEFQSGGVNGSNDTFTSNVATGSGSACSNSTSPTGYGGALYVQGESIRLTGSTFKSNTASAGYQALGGAIYGYGSVLNLSGETFTSNVAQTSAATQNDDSEGGAIYDANNASLKVGGSTFTSNSAVAQGAYSYEAYGGAISNSGSLSSTGNVYSSNSVAIGGAQASEAYGGALSVGGTSTVSQNDTFNANTATATGTAESTVSGGAIYAYAPLTISGGTFTSNAVSGVFSALGGAVAAVEATVVSNTTFASNVAGATGATANEIYGGAIDDEGGFTIGGSTFTSNVALQRGGAIYVNDTTDSIANSTFSGNSVTAAGNDGGGGAIFGVDGFTISNSTLSSNSVSVIGASAGGGGVFNGGGLTMTGTTVNGNSVQGNGANGGGGGILNLSGATITNSTLTSNTTIFNGGGILHNGGSTRLVNDTLYQNSASGFGGNIDNLQTLKLTNTIVAGGVAPAGSGPDIENSGTLTSGNYNLIQTAVSGNAIGGTTTNDLTATPLLGTLANNGGPTLTLAELAGSPTIEAIASFANNECNGASGTGVDQRGFTRGYNGRCDIGAYEYNGIASSIRSHPTPAVPWPRNPHEHKSPPIHRPSPARVLAR